MSWSYRMDVMSSEYTDPLYTEYTELASHQHAVAYAAQLAEQHGGDPGEHYTDVWGPSITQDGRADHEFTVDIGGHIHDWDGAGECACGCDTTMFAAADRWAGTPW